MEREAALNPAGRRIRWSLAILLAATPPAWGVKIATYNLLNYDGTNRAAEFRTITEALQADILITQEISGSTAPNAFLAQVLNGSGGPGGYAKATFQTSPDTSNALFYRTAKFAFNGNDPDAFKRLPTSLRDINRWKLRLVGYTSAGADVYIYSMHLKASQGYEDDRAAEAAVARNDANSLPAGTNFIYAGDLNVYTSNEDAYDVQLTGSMANNNGRAFDPVNASGNWHDNATFALLHTQSTCISSGGCAPGGATGGLDDRFDHLLIAASLKDLQGFDYVPTTFVAYGNDGEHFNNAIDGGGFNNAVGLIIAGNLRLASDHLPVAAEFQVPAMALASPSPLDFGTAIVGSAAQRALTVTNTGNVALFGHVAPLNYTLPAAPAGFSGPSGAFAAAAGASGNDHVYTMTAASPGPRFETLVITTDADDNPTLNVTLAGTVVDHARPSIAPDGVVTSGAIDFGSHPIGEFTNLPAQAYNYDFSSAQAMLEIYAAEFTGADAARFNIAGGFFPATVGGTPATYDIVFADAGAQDDTTYTATLTFRTRDQSNLPGATNLADLSFSLTAHVLGSCPDPRFDADEDDDVDLMDFAAFQACFTGPNRVVKTACECFDADLDTDVDLLDFAQFQACFNGPNSPPKPSCAS